MLTLRLPQGFSFIPQLLCIAELLLLLEYIMAVNQYFLFICTNKCIQVLLALMKDFTTLFGKLYTAEITSEEHSLSFLRRR